MVIGNTRKRYIRLSKVGPKAHTVAKVWKLGPHRFRGQGHETFRIVYLITKKGTYYIDFTKSTSLYNESQSEEKN